MKKILILCTGNSCRSQIAHGFLDHLTNNSVSVFSAGIEKHGLNKNAVKCMAKIGLDISDYNSNHIDEYLEHNIDLVVTVCDNAKEICPVFPKKTKFIHHSFNDPASAKGKDEEVLKIYRNVRDQLEDYIKSDLLKLLC